MTLELWAFPSVVPSDRARLRGMAVQAPDGGIGKVEDVVERESRAFLLVDTGPWIFGKTIKLPAGLVRGVDVEQGIVLVDRPKDQIKNAPEQDGDLSDETAHEDALTRHYAADEDDRAAVGGPPGPPQAAATAPGGIAPAGTRASEGGPPADAFPAGLGDRPKREGTEARSPGGSLESETGEGGGGTGDASAPTSAPARPLESESGDRPSGTGDDSALSTESAPPNAPDHIEVGRVPTVRSDALPESERPSERAERDEARAAAPASEPGTPGASEADAPTPRPAAGTGPARAAEERAPAVTAEQADGIAQEQPGRHTPARPRERASERPGHAPAREGAERRTRPRSAATGDERAGRPTTPTAGKRVKGPKRGESDRGSAKRQAQRGKSARNDQPLPRYDSLTAAEVVGRLRALTQSELAKVERYEQRGASRQTILTRVASLREKEPWRGYDTATVKEVREKLARANSDRVTAVRDYERRHRSRTGVMEAARRRLESM